MSTVYEYRPGPTHVRERRSYTDVADHMRKNPGVWVKVTDKNTLAAAYNMTWQIKNGGLASFRPTGAYDAYSNGTEVIARYTGGEQ